MKKRLLVVAALATALTGTIAGAAGAAGAAQPGQSLSFGANKLTCFDGTSYAARTGGSYYGLCSMIGGVAILDNVSNDKTPENPGDQWSGVYLKRSTLVGKAIGGIRQLGFSYTGTTPGAGAPRIDLPIKRADGTQDTAFISAYHCNDGAGNVDVVNDTSCGIYIGSEFYANWAAMLAAHADYRVVDLPSVVADEPGKWTVSNVKLGQFLAGLPRG